MRTPFSTRVIIASLALVAFGAQAEDRKRTAQTPAVAAPTAQTLSPAGEGRRAWLKYTCSGCHGDRAQGGMGPNIQHVESGDLSEAVREGEEGGMPSYRRILTTTEIANLGVYLRSIGTTAEPRFFDWWVPVPPK